MNALRDVAEIVSTMPPVSLEDIERDASLQTRRDRKYVLLPDAAERFISAASAECAALEVDGRRHFAYETLYFDTDDLTLYLGTAHRRPFRMKVRLRRYVDSRSQMIEVKAKDQRGRTIKHRADCDWTGRDELTEEMCTFVNGIVDSPPCDSLALTLTTRFVRTTLLAHDRSSRTTIDHGLSSTAPDGRVVRPDIVVVETKSTNRASTQDRWLWSHGHRPTAMSKYCTSLAALDPGLPSNHWHRTLRRYFADVEFVVAG